MAEVSFYKTDVPYYPPPLSHNQSRHYVRILSLHKVEYVVSFKFLVLVACPLIVMYCNFEVSVTFLWVVWEGYREVSYNSSDYLIGNRNPVEIE